MNAEFPSGICTRLIFTPENLRALREKMETHPPSYVEAVGCSTAEYALKLKDPDAARSLILYVLQREPTSKRAARLLKQLPPAK